MGIKLTADELKKIAWDFYKKTPEPSPTMLDRAISDAATAHAVREIGKKLKRYPIFRPDGTWYTIKLEDWQAILAEAGVKEAKAMTEMPDGSWRNLDDLRWVWSWSFSWPWQCSFWSWVHSEWWQNNQTWGWRWFGLTHRAEGK